ncbi:sensor domain-containing protein [Saccharospirillum alexandrii]|uniref:sensor domain-containing protein n=1 Tax=Saccharospirillum alexandrii TaxID=2448477 RepID=UPI000FD935DB|nr:EAL domain-containing protein [Saccharospirillum alexandrii]
MNIARTPGSLDLMPSGYLVTDNERSILYANRYALAQLGHDDLGGTPLFDIFTLASCILFESYIAPLLLKEGACDEIQLTLKAADGSKRSVVTNIRRDETDNNRVHWTFINASQRDKLFQELIDARNLLEEKTRFLEARTVTDDVTGLPNRLSVTQYLTERMSNPTLAQSQFVVLFIDLDGFKSINDTYGHAVGDQFLKAVGQRLARSLRASDLVARYGGDEYVVLLQQTADTANTNTLMIQRIVNQLNTPFQINGNTLSVSASAGATHYPQRSSVESEQLIRQADQAMYKAKLAGKNQIRWFDPDWENSQRTQHELTAQIRQGIELNQFLLHYQPKINLKSGTVIGLEALIRWQHPNRGLLMPGDFLMHIENQQIELELGDWVIDTALKQATQWHQRGLPLPVSVNVSGFQLMDPQFLERLTALLYRYPDLPRQHFELELLETCAIDDSMNIANVIASCRRMGLLVSLDDFGTGYSTLSHLKDLSVDILKIDRSFVQDMLTNPSNIAIIKGIIGFAKAFDCKAIAEGIESADQQAALLQLGCQTGQGYHIASPMPGESIETWLTGRPASTKP